jgi:hypothetical protein
VSAESDPRLPTADGKLPEVLAKSPLWADERPTLPQTGRRHSVAQDEAEQTGVPEDA